MDNGVEEGEQGGIQERHRKASDIASLCLHRKIAELRGIRLRSDPRNIIATQLLCYRNEILRLPSPLASIVAMLSPSVSSHLYYLKYNV